MTFIIIAIFVAVLSIAALYLELRAHGLKVLKAGRFWIGALVVVGTFLIIYFSHQEQNIQSALTDLKIGKVQEQSSDISEKQKLQLEKQEAQLQNQEAQLAKAKAQEDASKKQLDASERELAISDELREAQKNEIELMTRLNLNHALSGLEISYPTPSDRWAEIVKILEKMKPPKPGLSFADFDMIAEKEGDHWTIDFQTLATTEGNRHIGRISTAVAGFKDFERALAVASPGLRIEWGDGTGPWLEPSHGDYPTAIYLSREKIGLILRPPLIRFSLNDLRDLKNKKSATVTFFLKDYPDGYRKLPSLFHLQSLDPALILDQTIQLNWTKRGPSTIYEAQMNRVMSGPYPLNFQFNYFNPSRLTKHQRQ